jgi:UDP-glucose 4-epimerase
VPAFVDAALAGKPLVVHGDGHQSRDFTYVETVTETIADAIARRVTSDGPVNLAFGSRVDLLELITELERVLGHALTVEHIETRAGDVKHSQADSTRLRELFPDIVPAALPEALRATVDWFRSEQQ